MTDLSDKLKEKLDRLPELPGIYKMLDSRGDIIYVGKSKCLKRRVRSYFTGKHDWSKIRKLVTLIHDIDYVVTDTHLEARMLECQLIKSLKPAFNSQMKNDQEYVYLKVEKSSGMKALSVASERSEDTYGPFRREYSLKEIIDSLEYIFPILKNGENYELTYHIFPYGMESGSFEQNRDSLLEAFSGSKHMDRLIHTLDIRMQAAAADYKFETAAKYRDIIKGLDSISRVLWRYQEIMTRDILLKIPTGQKSKLFYIANGAIVCKQAFDNPTKEDIDMFIRKGSAVKQSVSMNRNEKADMDYQDVLYSEINALPSEMVHFLASELRCSSL